MGVHAVLLRCVQALCLSAMAVAGRAEASSFVVLGDRPAATPSIVAVGAPSGPSTSIVAIKSQTPGPGAVTLAEAVRSGWAALARAVAASDAYRPPVPSASIVALGEPAPPPVTEEKVAAIGPTEPKRILSMPMVIRGGITGDAFTSGSGLPAASPAASGSATATSVASARAAPVSAPIPSEPAAPKQPDQQSTLPVPGVGRQK